MSKLSQIGRWLGQHAKAFVGAAGTAGTVAGTLFPASHTVQEWSAAIGIVSTYLLVHITPNASTSSEDVQLSELVASGPVTAALPHEIVDYLSAHTQAVVGVVNRLGDLIGQLVQKETAVPDTPRMATDTDPVPIGQTHTPAEPAVITAGDQASVETPTDPPPPPSEQPEAPAEPVADQPADDQQPADVPPLIG